MTGSRTTSRIWKTLSDPEAAEKDTAWDLEEKRPRPPSHSQTSAPATYWELLHLELKTSHAFLPSFISIKLTNWQWAETLVSPTQGDNVSIKPQSAEVWPESRVRPVMWGVGNQAGGDEDIQHKGHVCTIQ